MPTQEIPQETRGRTLSASKRVLLVELGFQTQPDKPKIRPAMFNGNTSWEDYLAQFELIAEINRWNDSMKATYLAVSLSGPAQAVLGDLEPKARKNFAELTNALAERFGTENQQQVYRTALKTHSQQGDETLPELAQSVHRLTRQAYPEAPHQLRVTILLTHLATSTCDGEYTKAGHRPSPLRLSWRHSCPQIVNGTDQLER